MKGTSQCYRKEKEMEKNHKIKKGKNRFIFCCRWHHQIVKNPKMSWKELLELISEFSKVAKLQNMHEKSIISLC